MDKRAIVFLAVGVICAGVVVVAAAKFLQGSEKEKKGPEGVKVLVAAQQVDYGTVLELPEDDKKGNVGFMRWPKEFVPENAVTSDEELKEKELVALGSFIRYEPVLKEQMLPKEDFIPEDMLPRRIEVDPEDVEEGLLKAGMRVDVYKNYKKFMQCVRICAVGELKYNKRGDTDEEKKKDGPPDHAYVLIKRDQMVEFEKARDSGDLKVFPSGEECTDGPVLVSKLEGAKGRAAGELLQKGANQVAEGSLQEAIATFNNVAEEYSDVAPAVEKANQWLTTCREMVAQRIYLQAQEAFIAENFEECNQLVAQLLDSNPEAGETVEQAKELQKVAQNRVKQKSYETLLGNIEKSLGSGNFPQAEKLLNEKLQKEFVETEFQPEKGMIPPSQAMQKYQSELQARQRAFNSEMRIFETLRRTGNVRRAQQKFQEMARRFPQHPYINTQMNQANN